MQCMLIIAIRILFIFIKYDLLSCTTKEHFSGSLSCFVTIVSCSWHKTSLVDINAILHFCLARHFKDMPNQSLLLIAVDLKLLLSCCHCCHMNLLQFRLKIFDCGFRRTSVESSDHTVQVPVSGQGLLPVDQSYACVKLTKNQFKQACIHYILYTV